jgi:hypothetical protein
LFNIAGFERKYKTDEDFAKAISQNMKAEAETQLRSSTTMFYSFSCG